mgnify:CR=1 FL=1
MIGFFSKWMLWYNHDDFEQMCLFIWTGFSGERSGQRAACLNFMNEFVQIILFCIDLLRYFFKCQLYKHVDILDSKSV